MSPELPQRTAEDLGVPGPFPPLPVEFVATVATEVRAWALGESAISSGCRGVESPGTGKPL